jgi:hypothetical protein
VQWTKLRDGSIRFFHATATERFRINTITSLDDEDGRTIYTHVEKATVILQQYKGRLGSSVQQKMHFDL